MIQILRGRLVNNAASLYVVQGLNYLLPLLLFPYLLRVLGPQTYGSIIFAQSIVGYAIVITDFGFNLTAARDISIARDDPASVGKIFWTTLAAKGVLLTACAVLLLVVMLTVPALNQTWPLALVCSSMVFGNVIFPQWYFQGLEILSDAALVQAVSKVPYALCAVAFIRSPDDLWIAAFIMSAQQLFAVFTAFVLRKRIFPEVVYFPAFGDIRKALSSALPVFLGNASSTLYGNTNTFVLGLISGEVAVASYNLGLRVVAALQGLAAPVTQSIFPRASLLFSQDRDRAWTLIRRVAWLLLPALALICLTLGIFAPQVVTMLGGTPFLEAASTLRIMLIVPVLVALGTLLAHCVMINLGLTRELLTVYAVVGFFNLALLPFLVRQFAADGAAISLAFSEAMIEILLIWTLWKRRRALG